MLYKRKKAIVLSVVLLMISALFCAVDAKEKKENYDVAYAGLSVGATLLPNYYTFSIFPPDNIPVSFSSAIRKKELDDSKKNSIQNSVRSISSIIGKSMEFEEFEDISSFEINGNLFRLYLTRKLLPKSSRSWKPFIKLSTFFHSPSACDIRKEIQPLYDIGELSQTQWNKIEEELDKVSSVFEKASPQFSLGIGVSREFGPYIWPERPNLYTRLNFDLHYTKYSQANGHFGFNLELCLVAKL